MSRLHELWVALTSVVVEYHAKKFKQDLDVHAQHIVDEVKEDDDEIVDLLVQAVEEKEVNLQALISQMTQQDSKRQSLWQAISSMIGVIKPLIMTQRLLQDDEVDIIQKQLVDFIMMLQQALNTHSPNKIGYYVAEQAQIQILGLLNELQSGYGLSTSGCLIRDKVLVLLFPWYSSTTMQVTERLIQQAVGDILREYQYSLLQEENKALRYVNETLQQQVLSTKKPATEASTQTSQVTVSSLSIFTKYLDVLVTPSKLGEDNKEENVSTLDFFYDG